MKKIIVSGKVDEESEQIVMICKKCGWYQTVLFSTGMSEKELIDFYRCKCGEKMEIKKWALVEEK